MRAGAEPVARRAGQALQRAGIPMSGRVQHGKRELIVRDQQGIVDFLSRAGLTGASLWVEDKAILRAMRDQANRIRNCDTANINKTLRAAGEQTDLAQQLVRCGLLQALPPRLRELAEARLQHPEESLSELGKRLSPPVTKSTVEYRWKRLKSFADVNVSGAASGE
jgi:DNA-binding protein WhiA